MWSIVLNSVILIIPNGANQVVALIVSLIFPTVVHQSYKMQVYDEFVIRENMALMRCHVPSIVREYVRVVAWLRDEQVLVTATHNPRKSNEQIWLFTIGPITHKHQYHSIQYNTIQYNIIQSFWLHHSPFSCAH